MKERKKRVTLTDDQIKEIQAALELGRTSQQELADKYNVSQALISYIRSGKKVPKGNAEVNG